MGCGRIVQDDLEYFIAEEVSEPIGPAIAEALLFWAREGSRRWIVGARGISGAVVRPAIDKLAIAARSVAEDQRHLSGGIWLKALA